MAITTTTFSLNSGFARTSVITQLESAFTWLGFNADQLTGIVTGINAYGGGGDTNASGTFEDVRQTSTTGIGTGASFYVTRNSGGVVDYVYVNRPGAGYTSGEQVTLSAEDIGGSANGAVAIGITVFVAGGASPTGFGTTTAFFDKDITSGATYPWGVARHTIQSNKKYGDTYRGFQVTQGGASSAFVLRFASGSSFHPWDTTNTSNKGNYHANRFAGADDLDTVTSLLGSSSHDFDISSLISHYNTDDLTISSSNGNSYQLDLNIYRSGLDPKFAVFSYKQPTLSSTHLTSNSFGTFFFHNFTTNIWDLNELFLGGLTFIISTVNTSYPSIEFRTYTQGLTDPSNSFTSSYRCAESGYNQPMTGTRPYHRYVHTYYESQTYPQSRWFDNPRIYYRNNSTDAVPVGANSNFNAVIKGIPLSIQMIPCPYYLPDDFVLIDFDYATPAANIQQGDTITISGSEVYTVITGSYNQTTRTRGILFCARKV